MALEGGASGVEDELAALKRGMLTSSSSPAAELRPAIAEVLQSQRRVAVAAGGGEAAIDLELMELRRRVAGL